MTSQENYVYSSKPRAVRHQTQWEPQHRHDQCMTRDYLVDTCNIMWDRRVIRGNTYAMHTNNMEDLETKQLEVQKYINKKREYLTRKRKQAADGLLEERKWCRDNRQVQTELYLEEITDMVIESDIAAQTDEFLDRPPSPLFIPAKSGADVATQIYEGDLFEYDLAVKPILEVLVGKTIEQALLEVMEEEELANLRAQQRAYEELRNAELVEVQRLEEQNRRIMEEKRRRLKEAAKLRDNERETTTKLKAMVFSRAYLSDLLASVFGNLSDAGYFYDPVERDLEQNFLPWLSDQVVEEMEKAEIGRRLADDLIMYTVRQRNHMYETAVPIKRKFSVIQDEQIQPDQVTSLEELFNKLDNLVFEDEVDKSDRRKSVIKKTSAENTNLKVLHEEIEEETHESEMDILARNTNSSELQM